MSKRTESKLKKSGCAYKTRAELVNQIYEKYCRSGLSNRDIFRLYIYPKFGICERTFYNYLKCEIYLHDKF